MITIVIMVILATIAAPSFVDVLLRSRVNGVASDLMATITAARTEAVRRGQPVTICKSANGTSCATSGEWDNGWIMFVNEDNDVPAVVDTNEAVLKVRQDLSPGVTVRSDNFTSEITFSRSGLANNAGTFVICIDSDETRSRAITLLRTRAAMSTDSNGDKIPEKSSGDGNLVNIISCESP